VGHCEHYRLGTLQALSTALAGTLVILAIRHRVDFRLDE
jgi:hypothetical protein